MSDADLYDEFGNYIGPESDSSDSEPEETNASPQDDVSVDDQSREDPNAMDYENTDQNFVDGENTDIVLHEDKQHYPTASDVYGEGVFTNVIDEDSQALEEPVLKREGKKVFYVEGKGLEFKTGTDFTVDLMGNGELGRTVAIIGNLHSGKTSVLDCILSDAVNPSDTKIERYSDTLKSEIARNMSIKMSPINVTSQSMDGKSMNVSWIDCPGHCQFFDETVGGVRGSDAVVVVLDCLEGLVGGGEMGISEAIKEGVDIILCLNKLDRLITELHLPPSDCYYKLLHTIDTFNTYLRSKNPSAKLCTPERGNVIFGSSECGFFFTLESFCNKWGVDGWDRKDLSKRMWGNAYFDPTSRTFKKSTKDCPKGVQRTFIEFILEPIYKVFGACLGSEVNDLQKVLREVGVMGVSKKDMKGNVKTVLKKVFQEFLGAGPWVDAVFDHVQDKTVDKLTRNWNGNTNGAVMESVKSGGDALLCEAFKCLSDGTDGFLTLVRVYGGALKVGDTVKVLGEDWNEDDDEDVAFAQITGLYLPHGRFRTSVNTVTAGNCCLVKGIDGSITKTATIVDTKTDVEELATFAPLNYYIAGGESTVKLAVEPLNPSELPKLVSGLRKVCKSYGMARTKVEESGEHVVIGVGEIYLDCVMHDLRHMFSDIEIKVADPVVTFMETVVETSSVKCFASTPNKKNKITVITEPLEDPIAMKIERGEVKIDEWTGKQTGDYFEKMFGWDKLSARSVWCFGPTERGANLLMDDTLPSEVDKKTLTSVKPSLCQGFKWATREGPLCEEPVRGTKVKILDAELAQQPIMRGGGQIIPTTRRAVYSSFLTATPKLMEPIYRLEVQCPSDVCSAVFPLLQKRRGHVVKEDPKAGATFSTIKAYIPVIESFGFETDLRSFTQGQAMVTSVLDHYALVPGNPLDSSIVLHPLEPSPTLHLAREFLVKTRRRKGLSDDVSVFKYFDEGVRESLAE